LDEETQLDEADKEIIVKTCSDDNLDLGCSLIRKSVMEKALEDVNQDITIMETLEKRNNARERDEPYIDLNFVN